MAAIPPALIYLTVYNPTLKPQGTVDPDDEDAEEQAHILFYTARERAVSRDRMLRQIGLAKALVNFSSMFSAEEGCSGIHSQSRRMIIISPEPDFYIHACLEVSKTPRTRSSRIKTTDKGKQAQKDTPTGDAWYYHDGSVNDAALQFHLQTGYELFKLTHGTFASILSTLGHQALELQLERFFTVWAWKWDVEDGFDFGKLYGTPLHPQLSTLQPALDAVGFQLDDEDVPLVLNSPYFIPSSRYQDSKIPSSFPRHLLALFPAPQRPSFHHRMSSSISTMRPPLINRTWTGVTIDSVAPTPAAELTRKEAEAGPSSTHTHSHTHSGGGGQSSRFLGMPTVNMSMPSVSLNMEVMDVRKWNWGALTFGKGPGRKARSQPLPSIPAAPAAAEKSSEQSHEETLSNDSPPQSDGAGLASVLHITLDPADIPLPPGDDSDLKSTHEPSEAELADALGSDIDFEPSQPITFRDSTSRADDDSTSHSVPTSLSSVFDVSPTPIQEDLEPLPPVYGTSVLLDGLDSGPMTRRRVLYITNEGLTFVVIRKDGEDVDDEHRTTIARLAVSLLGTLSVLIRAGDENKTPEEVPSLANLLSPRDHHIILRPDGSSRESQDFTSKSEHLANARLLLTQNSGILEVFSRGQQPQHWHIARRYVEQGSGAADGDVYLEVMRKETSLTDVDNVLASVGR